MTFFHHPRVCIKQIRCHFCCVDIGSKISNDWIEQLGSDSCCSTEVVQRVPHYQEVMDANPALLFLSLSHVFLNSSFKEALLNWFSIWKDASQCFLSAACFMWAQFAKKTCSCHRALITQPTFSVFLIMSFFISEIKSLLSSMLTTLPSHWRLDI